MPDFEDIADPARDPHAAAVAAELEARGLERLFRAWNTLPKRKRAIVTLRLVHNAPWTHVARAVRYSPRSCRAIYLNFLGELAAEAGTD